MSTTNSDALLQIRDYIGLVLLDLMAEDGEATDDDRDIVAELTDILLESMAFQVIGVDGDTISCTVTLSPQ